MSREGEEGDGRSPWGRLRRGADTASGDRAGTPDAGGKNAGPGRPGAPRAHEADRTGHRRDERRNRRPEASADARPSAPPQRDDTREGGSPARGPWQRDAARPASGGHRGEVPRSRATEPGQRLHRPHPEPAGAHRSAPARHEQAAARQQRPHRNEGHEHREPPLQARPPRDPEQKICGLNAARAAFAARPEALRKVYLAESRIGTLRELLAFCVAKRLGYRVVEDDELERISGSSHHEGICLLMQPRPELDLDSLLASLPRSGAVRLLWLDGVGNPHNLGAVLRSAAHFGAQAVLLPPQSRLTLSAAAARVAEGGAEHVPLLHVPGQGGHAEIAALERLAEAGFVTVATLPAGAPDLYAHPLPQRAVFVLGAEGEGMQKRLVEHCERAVSIPGSGRVESLNIANAVAVLLAEHWRQHPPR